MGISDWRGITRLATQATNGVARIVEGVHQNVWSSMGFPSGKTPGETRGFTRMIYQTINGTTQLVGKSADTALAGLQRVLDPGDGIAPESPRRRTFLSVANGVIGDHLVNDNNPFAIPMTLTPQVSVPSQKVSGKVLLLIHGLCMNDLQQHAGQNNYELEYGQLLAGKLGYHPVYLRYNSGLHVSQNGRELAARLEQWLELWPTEVVDLSVLAHSMGGLLIRSAFHYARQEGLNWPERVKHIVFLGTPHHGAPLERVGNWLDLVLGSIPHTRPFTALAKVRSAGVTDLRYGNVLDEDWHGRDRFKLNPDERSIAPLPDTANCYSVAATLAKSRSALADHVIGDGLVPLHSALGRHKTPARNLGFDDKSQFIAYNTNHMNLLNSREVSEQVVEWLTPGQAGR